MAKWNIRRLFSVSRRIVGYINLPISAPNSLDLLPIKLHRRRRLVQCGLYSFWETCVVVWQKTVGTHYTHTWPKCLKHNISDKIYLQVWVQKNSAQVWANIASIWFLLNHGNIATEESPKSELCPTLIKWLQGFFAVHSRPTIDNNAYSRHLNKLEQCICTTSLTNRDSNQYLEIWTTTWPNEPLGPAQSTYKSV